MNILIVDDDELLVKKIVEGIKWEEIGIEMTFTANNIRQAKKVLEEFPVHILLSDIEMPQENGLELLEWIREKKLPIHSIFLSSYAYFTYAQKAMALKSCEYLLKPTSNKELSDVIKKIASSIRAEEDRKEQDRLEQKNQYWLSRIMGDGYSHNSPKEYSELYQEEDSFQLLMICLQLEEIKKKAKDQGLFPYIIKKAVDEFFLSNSMSYECLIKMVDSRWIILYRGDNKILQLHELMKLKSLLEERLGVGIYLFGKMNTTFLAEVASTIEIIDGLSREAVIGESGILHIEVWRDKDKKRMEPEWGEWSKEILFSEDLNQLGIKIDDYLKDFWKINQMTTTMLEWFYRDFMQMIFRWFDHKRIQFSQIFMNEEFDSYYNNSIQSLTKTITFIHWVLHKMDAYQQADGRQDKVVEKLKTYIHNHLKEELSRKELANIVFLSEDYISRIFVNATGISISNYVTECRVKAAMDYLRETDWTVSKVAMQVGYTNFSYFSKMFRKISGYTPNEYRNRYNKKQN